MRELTNSVLNLTWQLPLSGAQQITKLFSRPLTGALSQGGGILASAANVIDEQVDNAFKVTSQTVEDLQRKTVDYAFDLMTFQPFLEAMQQNFPLLGPQPEVGSQKQPELDYLKAINDARPPGGALTILVPGVLYSNLNRGAEGIRVYEGYLKDFESVMKPWQHGVYLSTLALLQASEAQVTPIWEPIKLISLGREALESAKKAKEVTADLPDFDETTAKVIARWVSGLLNSQLPPPIGDKGVGLADLKWVEKTITKTPESASAAFMFLRETYFLLAKAAEGDGDTAQADEYLRLSAFRDLKPRDTIVATLFSGDTSGLRDGIKHVLVSGNKSVFTISGQDMSEFNFVLTKDRQSLVAIDAGTRYQRCKAAYEYLEGFAKVSPDLPWPLPPVTDVIYTHAHWDHIGGQAFFRELNPEVKFHARQNYGVEQEAIVHLTPPYDWFLSTEFDLQPCIDFKPDYEWAGSGDVEEIGGTKFEIWLPEGGGGETPDGLFVHLPEQKIVFAGDFIVPWVGSPYNAEGDLDGLLKTIDWISEKAPDVVLYGHEALTVFFSKWQTLARMRSHLAWLQKRTYELIGQHHTRVEIQEMNLYPQAILEEDQWDTHLPYLLLRESVINRLYRQKTGYWGAKLENVNYLTPSELGSIFKRYLGLSAEEVVDAMFRMGRNGDHELAAQLADWALTQFPGDQELKEAQGKAFRKLKEKWQVLNVFKFIMYSEQINDPTFQLPLGEEPIGYEHVVRDRLDAGFSNASLSGVYEYSVVSGGRRSVGVGTLTADGEGHLHGTQRIQEGTRGGGTVEQEIEGTYKVFSDGTAEAHLTLTTDGRKSSVSFDYVALQAEKHGSVRLATELQGVTREPALDPATGERLEPQRLATYWIQRVGEPEAEPSAGEVIPESASRSRPVQAAPSASAGYQIYRDKRGEYRWRLRSSDGEILAASSDGFATRKECEEQVELVRGYSD